MFYTEHNEEPDGCVEKVGYYTRVHMYPLLSLLSHAISPHICRKIHKTIQYNEKQFFLLNFFAARQQEINMKQRQVHEESQTRVTRTFEWLHTQVGNFPEASTSPQP